MSIETTAPFLYNYWPQLLALIAAYISSIYFINLKNPDKSSTSNSSQPEKKKYQTPDQGMS